jgi:hypothetical protein
MSIPASAQTCPCTIFGQQTPAVANENDTDAVELGVAFKPLQAGFITGVRFYKGSRNTGTHLANLWSANGTSLARATFTNETSSGWQTVSFSAPVSVSANTTYVASYYAPNGEYAADVNFFSGRSVTNGPLSVPADSASQHEGLYHYGGSAFPTSSWNSSNYWVDVVFTPASMTQSNPIVTITSPSSGSTLSGTATVSATVAGKTSITQVQLLVDGSAQGTLTAAPYNFSLNTTTLANGSHTIAVSALDSSGNTGSSSVTVNVSNAVQVSSQIKWPIEVMGAAGTTAQVSFNLNNASASQLYLQIHNYTYDNEGSVQVNNSAWISLNSQTVTLLGLAKGYGGIGGGFSTLKMTVNLPAGVLVNGANTIRFRFNQSDGISSGYRVLNFNFLANGSSLIPNNTFIEDNPNQWTAPLNNATDIAAGKSLWSSATLTDPRLGTIRAKCGSCHAQDGRDLKYFNYSNASIRARSQFHGLSSKQGDQIASYIRSLQVENPGRPWNPPYQPGPGLDSQPVQNWSAGAGLAAVLDSDAQTFNYIDLPNDYAYTSNLSARETPIAFPLPDWNHWLPSIHPTDSWGSNFDNSEVATDYTQMRSRLRYQDPSSYQTDLAKNWTAHWQNFLNGLGVNNNPSWTPRFVEQVYSFGQWPMVKNWEIQHEFGMEGLAQQIFGSSLADTRAWYTQFPFFASPNMQHIPWDAKGLANGTTPSTIYLAFAWYHVQLILNNSNRQQSGNSPIDWQYTYSFIKNLSAYDSQAQAGVIAIWQIKAMQILNNGKGPEYGLDGWFPNVSDLSRLVHPDFWYMWSALPTSQRAQITQAIVQAWFSQVRKFTPQQFYTGGFANSSETPQKNTPDGRFVDKVWFFIPQLRNLGVDPTLMSQIADWAKTLWPNANWNATKTASCYVKDTGEVRCSTQD